MKTCERDERVKGQKGKMAKGRKRDERGERAKGQKGKSVEK